MSKRIHVSNDAAVRLGKLMDESGASDTRIDALTALIYAAPTDPDTFAEFLRLGRFRRMLEHEHRTDLDTETIRDLEERFS